MFIYVHIKFICIFKLPLVLNMDGFQVISVLSGVFKLVTVGTIEN